MSNPSSLEAEALISRLSRRPHSLLKAMTTVPGAQNPPTSTPRFISPVRPSLVARHTRWSPAANHNRSHRYARCPVYYRFCKSLFEAVRSFNRNLPIETWSSLSQRCFWRWARWAWLTLYSIAVLHAALRSERCATCPKTVLSCCSSLAGDAAGNASPTIPRCECFYRKKRNGIVVSRISTRNGFLPSLLSLAPMAEPLNLHQKTAGSLAHRLRQILDWCMGPRRS